MNDDIKEILARLSRYVITPDVRHDFDDLLDYITNLRHIEDLYNQSLKDYDELQQELKYQEEAEIEYNEKHTKLMKEYIRLKEENERLKLEIERLNDVLVHKPDEKIMLKTNDGKELFIIQSERIDMQEELNKANMQLMIKLEDYKSRCEKAVEYIEKHKFNKFGDIDCGEAEAIIDILNGDK